MYELIRCNFITKVGRTVCTTYLPVDNPTNRTASTATRTWKDCRLQPCSHLRILTLLLSPVNTSKSGTEYPWLNLLGRTEEPTQLSRCSLLYIGKGTCNSCVHKMLAHNGRPNRMLALHHPLSLMRGSPLLSSMPSLSDRLSNLRMYRISSTFKMRSGLRHRQR